MGSFEHYVYGRDRSQAIILSLLASEIPFRYEPEEDGMHRLMVRIEDMHHMEAAVAATSGPIGIQEAMFIWREFFNHPLDPNTHTIVFPYRHFPIGTHRDQIRSWLEDECAEFRQRIESRAHEGV